MEQTGDIHLVLEDSYVNDILSIADSLYVGTSDGMIVYNKRASTLVKKFLKVQMCRRCIMIGY